MVLTSDDTNRVYLHQTKVAEPIEEQVNVDRQGRLALPSRIRRSLGISHGGKVSVRLDGSRVVLESPSKGVAEKVQEWKLRTLQTRAHVFVEEQRAEGGRWMSEEYARSKSGLR